jgi:hypothetical protein
MLGHGNLRGFNARDMENVLAAMDEDVVWRMAWKVVTSTAALEYAAIGHGNGRSWSAGVSHDSAQRVGRCVFLLLNWL